MKQTPNEWIFSDSDVSKESVIQNGNRMFCGNGFKGFRGTVDEALKDDMPCLIVNGIYDRQGDKWREPVNFPNPVFMQLSYEGKKLSLFSDVESHVQSVDFKYGIFSRRTVWNYGTKITVQSRRFLSMARKNLICLSYTVTSSEDISLGIDFSINADVYDANGPHFEVLDRSVKENTCSTKETLLCRTLENSSLFAVARHSDFSGNTIFLKANVPVSITVFASVITELDFFGTDFLKEEIAEKKSSILKMADDVLNSSVLFGFDALLCEHCREWEKIWQDGDVLIEGDDEAQKNVRYSLYHLQSIAPRGRNALSIPARGLSAQTYKGAVFWDTELFILPYFLYTEPAVARSFIEYRIKTLEGAKRKAASYGFEGAFYAWESQENGDDACSDYNVVDVFTKRPMRTYFRDSQIHISAAVVYALCEYVNITSDTSILSDGGFDVIFECAKFFISRCIFNPVKKRYEIHDVIGPDEYHERVNNNAYTNRMALFSIQTALSYAKKIFDEKNDDISSAEKKSLKEIILKTDFERFIPLAEDITKKLYIPMPLQKTASQNFGVISGVIEQFDSYFSLEDCSVSDVRSRLLDPKEYWGSAYGVASQTQIIKQADVVTMLSLFGSDYESDVLASNYHYYNPRTEHGSSLSACMYGLLACRIGQKKDSEEFFKKTSSVDLSGESKQWAGLVYIGGTHPAAQGGTWMMAILGFAGFSVKAGKIVMQPNLPESWKKLSFTVTVRGEKFKVTILNDGKSKNEVEICKK